MRKVMLDKDYIINLKSNPYIIDYKYNRLEYSNEFKIYCLMSKLTNTKITAEDIFLRAGIDTSKLHPDLPRHRINDWMKIYKRFGLEYFINE